MKTVPAFPAELLSRTPRERVTFFRDARVPHPHLVQADKALYRAVRSAADPRLVYLVGPTNVGKTTLMDTIVARILREEMEAMVKDLSYLPIAAVLAPPPLRGNVDEVDLLARALTEMGEPMVDGKVLYRRSADGNSITLVKERPAALLRSYQRRVTAARMIAMCIDEIHHLAQVSNARTLRGKLEFLKGLVKETHTTHALFGTYDALDFRDLSGQLGGLSEDIHFPRYRPHVPGETAQFRRAVYMLQCRLPVDPVPDFAQNHWEYLLDGWLGIIGLIKRSMLRALEDALGAGETTFTLGDLRKYELDSDRHDRIREEAEEGERRMADDRRSSNQLRGRRATSPSLVSNVDREDPSSNSNSSQARVPRRKRRLPGRRGWHRDPVARGVMHLDNGSDGG